jgi:phage gp29-like protein
MATIEAKDIFTEVLASDKLGSYQTLAPWIPVLSSGDPTMIWQQLMYNPWIAMAVYWDMEEKDAAVYSGIDTRKNNVLSKPRNILPASERRQDRKIAEFVEETLDRHFADLDSCLYEALDAIGKGVSIAEIIYKDAGDRVAIETLKFKPQHLFSFGETGIAGFSTQSMIYPQTGPLQLRTGVNISDMPLGGELTEDKFFVFSFRPKYGNRWGDPVHRKGYWPSWIKRNGVKAWLKYIEKGAGTVISRYNDGAAEAEQQAAVDAATAVVENSAVGVPKKFLIEVLNEVRSIGSSHKELNDDFCNAELSRIYVGQTLTARGSDGGGSRALGEVHERVSERITETDCKALMQVVNHQIIRQIVRLNFGPNVACPRWIIEYEAKEDLDSLATRYGVVRNQIGLELSKEQVRGDLQLEEPLNDDDTLAPPVAPQPAGEDVLDDDTITEFAEKKKMIPGSGSPSSSKTRRFARYRPSMIEFSDE